MSDGLRFLLGLALTVIISAAGILAGAYVGVSIRPNWSPGIAGLMLFGGILGSVAGGYVSNKLSLG